MDEWLKRFFYVNDCTLTLNGQTFSRSKCYLISKGSEKHVYQIEGTNQCFFIPNKYHGEESWNLKIAAEKFLLDQISNLGLKTQHFEIAPLEIHEPGKTTYTINVLVAKDFQSLCDEEFIIIHNHKGDQKITGKHPDFIAMKEKFKDKSFAKKMLKQIIKEYPRGSF